MTGNGQMAFGIVLKPGTVFDQPLGQRIGLVQVQHRAQRSRRQRLGRIGGNRDDEIIVWVARRLARRGAPDLDLEQVATLEAFDQYPVYAVVQLGNQVVHRQVRLTLELAHQRQPLARSHDDLEGTGFAVAKRILAFVIDVELVVRVLDHRHAQAAQLERRNELLDQVRLARAGIAGECGHLHV